MITVSHIGKKNLLEDCLNILRIKLEKNCLMKDILILPIENKIIIIIIKSTTNFPKEKSLMDLNTNINFRVLMLRNRNIKDVQESNQTLNTTKFIKNHLQYKNLDKFNHLTIKIYVYSFKKSKNTLLSFIVI